LNPPRDTNNDKRWDLDRMDLGSIDGPGDTDEFEPEDDDEEYDPHLTVVENLDEEKYETRHLWLTPLIRTTAFAVLVFFLVGFVAPRTWRALGDVFRPPTTPDYLSAVLVGGQPLIFEKNVVTYSIVWPSNYPMGDSDRLTGPLMRAMKSWEEALKGRLLFTPAQYNSGADLLVHFVTDLKTAGMAGMRPGPTYRPEVFIRLDVESPLPDSATLETIACHEIGHALGLWGHSDYEGDVMYPIAGQRTPSDRDIRTIRLLYGLNGGTG
jgi:hypothetical protein